MRQIYFVAGNDWVASSSFDQQVTLYDSKYTANSTHHSLTSLLAFISLYKLHMKMVVHCWAFKLKMFSSSLEAMTMEFLQ